MERRNASTALILLLSGLSVGATADGVVARFPANAEGVGCWELGAYSQFHGAHSPTELVADNPLNCYIEPQGSTPGWAWASPCTGCEHVQGKVDVIPAGSFADAHSIWYVTLPDHTKVYAIGIVQHFSLGLRMVRLWVAAGDLRRLDGKPLPSNPRVSGK